MAQDSKIKKVKEKAVNTAKSLTEKEKTFFEEKVVAVTGASAGAGYAIAKKLAEKGADLILFSRNLKRLKSLQEEIEGMGSDCIVKSVDVSNYDDLKKAADEAAEIFGGIDIWINNAMVTVFSPVREMKAEEYKRVTEVNYLGYVNGTLCALDHMVPKNEGHIVQIGSSLSYRGLPLQSAYCGTKFAIRGFTDSLRSELIHDNLNISLTMVQLPALNTPQFEWSKSRLRKKVQPVPPIFDPQLAADSVLWAVEKKKREAFVGFNSSMAVIMQKFIPGILDRVLADYGYAAQQTDGPERKGKKDNLWNSVDGDFKDKGRYTFREKKRSPQFWFIKHKKFASAVLAVAGIWLVNRKKDD